MKFFRGKNELFSFTLSLTILKLCKSWLNKGVWFVSFCSEIYRFFIPRTQRFISGIRFASLKNVCFLCVFKYSSSVLYFYNIPFLNISIYFCLQNSLLFLPTTFLSMHISVCVCGCVDVFSFIYL